MNGKSDIAFLLNPATPQLSSGDRFEYGMTVVAPPMSPPPAMFHRLAPIARSPEPVFSSSLMLLGSCIAPLEKMSSKKAKVPALSLAVLCEASSSSSSCSSASSCESDEDEEADEEEVVQVASTTPKAPKAKVKASRTRVRKARTPPCQVDGCKNIAVSRGCCVRHGGGSRCTIAGCTNRAKLYKRCFQHGGFKTCSTDGCTRKAKRYGHCWSHGGGRICEIPDCNKVSTQGGLCWAHGGGNRCKLEGCSRRSYQKYGYYCVDHASLSTGKAGGSASA
ncbi:hypothetical protein BBJ28_00007318 [Nothophytophthora sp. Chile5]|nr:hypothetical protein BBJ28_00007318 [Nothophytophthora sp. Chile5]